MWYVSAQLTPAQIIDGVVLSQESITDDPKRTSRGGDIHSGEGRDTGSTGVEDVVGSLEGVGLAAKVQGEVGQVGDLGAIDLVLAVPRFGGADSEEGISGDDYEDRKGPTPCATSRRHRKA
jgi:hypothetical protein